MNSIDFTAEGVPFISGAQTKARYFDTEQEAIQYGSFHGRAIIDGKVEGGSITAL
jgi:hypothetical protein